MGSVLYSAVFLALSRLCRVAVTIASIAGHHRETSRVDLCGHHRRLRSAYSCEGVSISLLCRVAATIASIAEGTSPSRMQFRLHQGLTAVCGHHRVRPRCKGNDPTWHVGGHEAACFASSGRSRDRLALGSMLYSASLASSTLCSGGHDRVDCLCAVTIVRLPLWSPCCLSLRRSGRLPPSESAACMVVWRAHDAMKHDTSGVGRCIVHMRSMRRMIRTNA